MRVGRKVLTLVVQFLLILTLYFGVFAAKIIPFFLRRKTPKKNSILYFAAFYPTNAGYHWRVAEWQKRLIATGFDVVVFSASKQTDFTEKSAIQHIFFLIRFGFKRFVQIIRSRQFETVIVRRELLIYNDYGNLFLDKLLLKYHPNAILDIDDDLSAAKNQPKTVAHLFGKICLENGDKFNETLKMYRYFTVASPALKERILSVNSTISEQDILELPTCVNYNESTHTKEYTSDKPLQFGWIGGDYNYPQLDLVIPILEKLSNEFPFELIVIGGEKYETKTSFTTHFKKWSLPDEIAHLQAIDVGLMPLTNDAESKGKGGFKLIQYMGLGIISIASSIGINKQIVTNGYDSFLASDLQDWETIFRNILSKEVDLTTIGAHAHEKIATMYSFTAHSASLIHFIHYVRNSGNN
jgi:glycosyltransferase involved in cell wall biosynthesis